MAEAGAAAASNGPNISDTGDNVDYAKTLLPPIGSRGSRRMDPGPNPQEVDKFSKAMDKVMADRAEHPENPADENSAGHIIARRENQMANKHGISKVGKGVVEKFHAARHNTAIMSAMGHPGLDKLVAKEDEQKRKRKARLKELTTLRTSMNGRANQRGQADGEAPTPTPLSQQPSSPELPNVYVALGQPVPASRSPSMVAPHPMQLPPAQPPTHQQQHQQQQQQQQQQVPAQPHTARGAAATATTGAGAGARSAGAGAKEAAASPRTALSRSAPSVLRPLGHSLGGGSSELEGQPHSKGASTARRVLPGNRWRRRSQAVNPKSGHSGDSVIRAGSRVGRILSEFGGHDDWCSVTVMRHSLATILQANIRGWLVRKKWRANPQAVVDAAKAFLEAERIQKERRAALKQELERRALTRKQKEKAANVLQMLFPQSMVNSVAAAVRRGSSGDNVQYGTNPVARAKWGRLNKNLDLATEHEERYDQADSLDASDSDMSDLGVEEMAMIKMRARTPPWQKAEQSQWEGQWAKLNTKTGRGNLDVVWDLSDTAARVQAVQQRRAERVAVTSPSLNKFRRGSGGAPSPQQQQQPQYDPATQPLPASVVNDLLVHRYIDKYTRLGLMDHLPLRSVAEAAIQQQMLLQEQQQQQQQQQLLLQQQQQQQQLMMMHHQQQQGAGQAGAGG